MKLFGIATLACLLVGTLPCNAQDPPPPYSIADQWIGPGWKEDLKIVVTPSGSAVAQGNNLRVSGTNINLRITPGFVNSAPMPNLPMISWLELRIGGLLVKRWEYPNGSEVFHDVRFASTHFADGTNQNITLQGEFLGWTNANPPEPFIHTRTVTLPTVIFNKVQHLGNMKNSAGVEDQLFKDNSDEVYAASKTALLASHTSSPATALLARSETRSSIIAKIKSHTVFSAMTHGDRDGFSDSSHPGAGGAPVIFVSDVGPQVSLKATEGFPKYNLIAFWACSVLAGGAPFPAVVGFGIANINQAICGFPLDVAAKLWSKEDWDSFLAAGEITDEDLAKLKNLSKHAEVFWAEIGNGNIVGNALFAANNMWKPMSVDLEKLAAGELTPDVIPRVDMIMSSNSDGQTRLRYVYLDSTQWAQLGFPDPIGRNVWFIILS